MKSKTKIELIDEIAFLEAKLDQLKRELTEDDNDTKYVINKPTQQFLVSKDTIYTGSNLKSEISVTIDDFTEMMSSIANLDFTKKIKISDEYNSFDMLGIGLNLMQSHLIDKVGKLNNIQSYFDSINAVVLITNAAGIITEANSFISKIGCNADSVLDGLTTIKEFLFDPKLLGKYGLDITRSVAEHDLSQNYFENIESEIVLRLSVRTTHIEFTGKSGYFYILEPTNRMLYDRQNYSALSTVSGSIQCVLNHEEIKASERYSILRSISQTYEDKSDLNLIETMILNSVKQLIEKY